MSAEKDLSYEEYNESCTKLCEKFFEEYGPAKQTLDSYDHFMKYTLAEVMIRNGNFEHEEIVDQRAMIRHVHRVSILDVTVENSGSPIKTSNFDGVYHILHPYEAKIRNFSYSRKLTGLFKHEIFEVDSAERRSLVSSGRDNVFIGEIPIMVKSKNCNLFGLGKEELIKLKEDPDDPGGYFIINGKEKVLISQERPAINKIFLFKPMCDADYQLQVEIRSTVHPFADDVSALWIRIPGKPVLASAGITKGTETTVKRDDSSFLPQNARTHNIKPTGNPGYIFDHKSLLDRQYRKRNPGFNVAHVDLRDPIPLMMLYRALGFADDKSIWQTIGIPTELEQAFLEVLHTSLEDQKVSTYGTTQEEALIFIGELRAQKEKMNATTGTLTVLTDREHRLLGENFINELVLPHVGNGSGEDDHFNKGLHIGYMVNRLVGGYMGWIPCDDRDHIENKRFDLAGPLLAQVLKRATNQLMEDMRMRVVRKIERGSKYNFFTDIAGHSTLTQAFNYALGSGNWGDKRKAATVRVGVSQPLNRVTPLATLSFLRRINSPLNRLVRMLAPRKVVNSGFGYICPSDSPEGEPVGLLKSLSISAQVTTESDVEPIVQYLIKQTTYHPISIEDIDLLKVEVKIFINSHLAGTCPRTTALLLTEGLKRLRAAWDEEKYENYKLKKQRKDARDRKRARRLGRHYYGARESEYGNRQSLQSSESCGISNQVSIVYDHEQGEIRIRTDGGRAVRPLLVVNENRLKLEKHQLQAMFESDNYSWADLVKDNVVEFIDASEEEFDLIAMYPKDLQRNASFKQSHCRKKRAINNFRKNYTHCEIDPSLLFGINAALIPYANHNQVARITFQTNMAKQSVGIYTMNFNHRYDAEGHVLRYPQKPLVTTRGASFTKYDDNPAGINVIVAIACWGGYNQEDSIIMNRSAIERGLFDSTYFKTVSDEARVDRGRGTVSKENFEKPLANRFNKDTLDKLDDDGLPRVGAVIEDDDILIGKTRDVPLPVDNGLLSNELISGRKKLDVSARQKISAAASGIAHVDSVLVFDNADGNRACKVRFRSNRRPQVGDKFSSRHGQKGVLGLVIHECDMPVSKDGIVPDIIINPHAIPSRMTIGQLIETLGGKFSACKGVIVDGTPFKEKSGKPYYPHTDFEKGLRECGFNAHGWETMYSGQDGRKIDSPIFIGPCFYQRLKHMVEDKLHCRARGPLTQLCRQPNPVLSKDGGLRFGEMERDSAVAHGGFQFLRERLFLVSDHYKQIICKTCGFPLFRFSDPRPNPEGIRRRVIYKCSICKTNRDGGITVEIPYAAKLLQQELACMNIKMKFSPVSLDEPDVNRMIHKGIPVENLPKVGPDDTPSVLQYILNDMNSGSS